MIINRMNQWSVWRIDRSVIQCQIKCIIIIININRFWRWFYIGTRSLWQRRNIDCFILYPFFWYYAVMRNIRFSIYRWTDSQILTLKVTNQYIMITLCSILWISNWIWHTRYETVDLILSIVKAIEVFGKYFLLPYISNYKYNERIQLKEMKDDKTHIQTNNNKSIPI